MWMLWSSASAGFSTNGLLIFVPARGHQADDAPAHPILQSRSHAQVPRQARHGTEPEHIAPHSVLCRVQLCLV